MTTHTDAASASSGNGPAADDSNEGDLTESMVTITRPQDGTAVIAMNRPERMNSMSFELMVPLMDAIASVTEMNDIRSVILTGTGNAFCSGADTRDSEPPPNIDGMSLSRIATKAMTVLSDLIPSLQRMPQPVICAVNGPAIGGGMVLTTGADIRIAGESAYFRAAGINNGLTATELGLSFLLPRAIGSSRAFEMMLTGRDISAAEAAEIGLVSRVVPDDQLMDEALSLARAINGWSQQGIALTKRMMWAGLETNSLRAAIELESHTQLFVRLTTQNFEEAVRARRDGRPPQFED